MYGESWSICSGRSCRLPLQYLPVLQTAAAANCPLVRGGRGDRRRGGGGRREMALIKGKEREQGKEKGEVWGESRVRHKTVCS